MAKIVVSVVEDSESYQNFLTVALERDNGEVFVLQQSSKAVDEYEAEKFVEVFAELEAYANDFAEELGDEVVVEVADDIHDYVEAPE